MAKLLSQSVNFIVVIICMLEVTQAWLSYEDTCNPKIDTGGYFERLNSDRTSPICSPLRRLRCNPRSKVCECDGALKLAWDEEAGNEKILAYNPAEKPDDIKGDCRVMKNRLCFIKEDCFAGLACVSYKCVQPK